MKKSLLFLGALLTSATGMYAQSLQSDGRTIINDLAPASLHRTANASRTTTCGPDTVAYTLYKATGISGISLNNATSASAIAQYFNCPQPITISGTDFFAYKGNATGGIVANVVVSVYTAGADSLPTGAALISATVPVDTVFGTGMLSVLIKHANFAPTTVTQPYCVVITNDSPNGVSVLTSSYAAGDGAGEWLGHGKIGGQWLHGYEIGIGSQGFNADVLAQPYVKYDVTAGFTQATDCIGDNGSGVWTNTSSPVLGDRMYNFYATYGFPEWSYTWNYGDGSPEENAINGAHTYPGTASWTVTLSDTLLGWGDMMCADEVSKSTGEPAEAAFTSSTNDLTATFTNVSTGTALTGVSWDFGDSSTSTDIEPSHTYAADGNYNVCLTVSNDCGTSQVCSPVTVELITGISDLLQRNLSVYPNPSEGSFTLELSGFESSADLNIFDMTGRNVMAEKVFIGQSFRKNINLDVTAGTYLLQLITAEGVATKKLEIH